MKKYENVSRIYLTTRTPIIVRLDGKAFHTYTRGFNRPFDKQLIESMIFAAKCVAKEMQGFKAAYIQSDEVSFLLTDYDRINTAAWFDNNLSKIITVSASIMTANFNKVIGVDELAYFDGRAFNIPESDISNYFLWRSRDWARNSISMYARTFFSTKELYKKTVADVNEMLFSVGKNWTKDLLPVEKNGTFLIKAIDENGAAYIKEMSDILPTYDSISTVI
jgi:tRNA(His) guanylyltransferase